jgi:hypothetical protein
VLTTIGAVALAGGGVGAYFLAGSALDSGKTSCATVKSTAPDACDGQKNTVRAWDFTAVGAWAAAAALGTVAVVLWVRPGHVDSSAALVVGPGAVGVEGRF